MSGGIKFKLFTQKCKVVYNSSYSRKNVWWNKIEVIIDWLI